MVAATQALGHAARVGGTLMADFVEREISTALEWLETDHNEHRRHTAVLMLKELAANAPTLFNAHVPEFLRKMWGALRDPKLAIREAAVEALSACLQLISRRDDSPQRQKSYDGIFSEVRQGLPSRPNHWYTEGPCQGPCPRSIAKKLTPPPSPAG